MADCSRRDNGRLEVHLTSEEIDAVTAEAIQSIIEDLETRCAGDWGDQDYEHFATDLTPGLREQIKRLLG